MLEPWFWYNANANFSLKISKILQDNIKDQLRIVFQYTLVALQSIATTDLMY